MSFRPVRPQAQEPLAPMDALFAYGQRLTDYEREEIITFPQVYYVGEEGTTKIDAIPGAPRNCGFDDQNGRYHVELGDHIAYRYKIISQLGKGAFGDCFKAYDFKKQRFVALKIIRNEARFHRQGKVECSVLDILRNEDQNDEYSLVQMYDHFVFRRHLCITFELLGKDLYSEIKAGNFVGFAPSRTRSITRDILACLDLLEELNIVHADLKPENILLRPESLHSSTTASPSKRQHVAKVIDFGSSCFSHEKVHTYIQSRYYRAPEIVLGLGYGTAIDMWSLGCILVELDTGHPLFPVKNEQDLILYQLELLGLPSQEVLSRAMRAEVFFDGSVPLRNTDRKGRIHPVGTRSLRDVCKNQDLNFINFVQRCLTWDPEDRMTPEEARNHPWVQQQQLRTSRPSMDSSSTYKQPYQPRQLSAQPFHLQKSLKTQHMAKDMLMDTADELNDSGFGPDESLHNDQQVPTFGTKWLFGNPSSEVPEIC